MRQNRVFSGPSVCVCARARLRARADVVTCVWNVWHAGTITGKQGPALSSVNCTQPAVTNSPCITVVEEVHLATPVSFCPLLCICVFSVLCMYVELVVGVQVPRAFSPLCAFWLSPSRGYFEPLLIHCFFSVSLLLFSFSGKSCSASFELVMCHTPPIVEPCP